MLSGRYAPNTGYERGSDGPSKTGDGHMYVFPLKYDLLPKVLKSVGYRTIMAGKWHLGFAQEAYTPENRGFDEYLGYLTGAEDYYTHIKPASDDCPTTRDLWYGTPGNGGPAGEKKYFNGEYSTATFTNFIVKQIETHDPTVPLFVYAAYQAIHGPLEVPKYYFDRYSSQAIDADDCKWDKQGKEKTGKYYNGFKCQPNGKFPKLDKILQNCFCNRLVVKAQVSALSEGVGNITDALKKRGMWNNTVLVFMGDNGGPTFEAHSNSPLRGGKLNFFEGGIRPATFVTSPLFPVGVRGSWYNGTVHETDWFATFLHLAGAALPQGIDGLNVWPTLLDPTISHRKEVLISDYILRQGPWKLVTGADATGWTKGLLNDCMLGTGGGWMEPPRPGNSSSLCPADIYTRPGNKKEIGCSWDKTDFPVTDKIDKWLCSEPCTLQNPCLWNLDTDPREEYECAADNKDIVTKMLARLRQLQKQFNNGTKVQDNGKFCSMAKKRSVDGIGPFLGPWVE